MTKRRLAQVYTDLHILVTLPPELPRGSPVKTVVDSMGIYLTYKDRFKESVETREIETIIEKEVNLLHWWQKLLMRMGVIFTLLFALKLYFTLK